MRVHELAKELGVSSKELLASLADMGVAGKSASSSVPEDMVPRLRASGGKATTAPAKPREGLEPPPPPPKPKPKPKPKAAAKPPLPPEAKPEPKPQARPQPRRARGDRRGCAHGGRRGPRAQAGAEAAPPARARGPGDPVGPRAAGDPRCDATGDRREDRPVAGRDREDPVHGWRHGHRDDVAHGRTDPARRGGARLHGRDRRARG